MTLSGSKLGKVPSWILVAALIVAGAGAAAGTVLQGQITGRAPATTGQALLLKGKPTICGSVDRSISSISDDNTSFTVAAELYNGDEYTIKLNLKNRSSRQMPYELSLDVPKPVLVGVTTPPTTTQTKNPEFKNTSDPWENATTENTTVAFDNANDWVDENFGGGLGPGNASWSQSLNIASLRGGVKSAKVEYSFQLPTLENVRENVRVVLENTTNDNTTIFENTYNASHGWVSKENDVAGLITEPGIYTLYLFMEADNTAAPENSFSELNWDNSQLKVKTRNPSARTSAGTWKAKAYGGFAQSIKVKVALPDDVKPGYYEIKGKIEAVNY